MKVIQGFLSEDERWYLANLAKTISFEPGRQGTGYEKSPVLISRNEMGGFTRLLGSQYTHCEMILKRSLSVLTEMCGQHQLAYDCYLLRFGEGAHIPPHLDDAPLVCQARVPDHTDTVECGGPVIVDDLCVFHADSEVCRLRDEIFNHQNQILAAKTRIQRLGAAPAPLGSDTGGPEPELR